MISECLTLPTILTGCKLIVDNSFYLLKYRDLNPAYFQLGDFHNSVGQAKIR